MFKINALTQKTLFALLVVVIALAAFPVAGAAAMEGEPPQVDPARLEEGYDKLVEWYNRQSEWMGKADTTVAKTQTWIDKATARGLDASAVQSALDNFAALYPDARVYNQQAGAILSTHAGFDDSGNVTDPAAAIETLRSLQAALKAGYDTMGGENHAGVALREAVKAFLDANRPK
jgi:hypothetical protein